MGWVIAIGMAAIVWLGLWRLGRMPRSTLELIGAALALGLAGYAWQGDPGLAGSPAKPPVEERQPDTAFATQRGKLMERFGNAAQVLEAADAMHRQGLEPYGIALLRGGIQKMPNSPDLWVGLGNALVQHADGMVTPPARYAFDRAAQLSPEHPAPPFFLGLAYAQSGQLDEAERVWQALLARTPPNAPWRADLERQLGFVAQARAITGR